ncbi:MAG: DNA gyrase subunit A, partial [Planctomycetota bacterium]
MLAAIEPTPLHEAARSRYLNYALSVITSRALPDVRDGLKPVQRRILYTMWRLRLSSDAKPRKCASVCGDVMGQYHPHGDQAIYDALVRMAQPWVLREPLIEGVGNFGSMDADPAAAYRYTECRLRPIATELLDELDQDAVHERATYDNERTEPVVLPSRAPTLLINGAQGIAVGMATSIPPHNLGEVCRALLKLMDKPDARTSSLIANDAIQGPDFPTGGEVLTSRTELRAIYETGHGSIKVRGTWKNGEVARSSQTVTIDSIPYGVNKAQLVEQIADVVLQRKLAGLVDVRDLSAEDVRIDLELKKDADPAKVMAYLYRQTSLQNSFAVNLTCLVPTGNPEVGRPERLGLAEVLRYFLIFRHEVATRRLEHEERALRKRIHMLEGFRVVFDALDEVIAIIRASDGKADAARRLMERFPAPPPSEAPEEDAPKSAAGKRPIKKGRGKAKPVIQVTQGLDAEQTDAILELKLYRLARLEIRVILDELKKRHARLKEVLGLLADDQDDYAAGRWALVRGEIDSLLQTYGDKNAKRPEGKRRTRFAAVTAEDEPV